VSDEGPVGSSPGAALAAARETLGLTPAQAAEQLRLTPEAIRAMEEGRYQVLGPAVFARGHLRKYAALLGQSAEELLRDYDSSSSRVAESSLIPPASAHTHVKSESRRRFRWQPWAIGAAAALVIAAAGWWYWQGRGVQAPEAQPVSPPASGQAEDTSPAGPPQESDLPAPAVPPEAAPVPSPTDQKTGSTGTGASGRLSLAFSGPCWVEVYDARGARLAFELVEAGQQRSFDGPAPWRVVLGNAPAVDAQIDGQPVAIPAALIVQNAATVSIAASGAVVGNSGGARES
jgi:cytoskeleton protein RodZ